MKIESVKAHAFGPFLDQTLDLAPGMTVIYGPNESGKSTWHAAIFAGLCGMRRGRGRKGGDSGFVDRHRPWYSLDWEVSTTILLEDGRQIELHHDLAGRVDCQARDVVLGRDYSDEIMNDGAPDGSKWLGLDRQSFLATACVRQADIRSVVDNANSLQEHMQRAAASANTESTAAAALDRLDQYQKENVGLDRSNSTRPLRAARNREQISITQLDRARDLHAEFVGQMAEIEEIEVEVNQSELQLQLVEAALLARDATAQKVKLERARALVSKYPTPPTSQSEYDSTADACRLAVDRWENKPAEIELSGASAMELMEQISQLPLMPVGDTERHSDVGGAKEAYLPAVSHLERHLLERPPVPTEVHSGGLSLNEVQALAEEIALEDPFVDPVLELRVVQAQQKVDSFSESAMHSIGASAVGKIPFLLRPFIAFVRIFGSIFRAIFGGGRSIDTAGAKLRALEELREAESNLGDINFRARDILRRKELASDKAKSSGTAGEPKALLQLASLIENSDQERIEFQRWSTRRATLQTEISENEAELREILRARGVADLDSVAKALSAYETACSERGKQAREFSKKIQLESALESRQREESTAVEAQSRNTEIGSVIKKLALEIGLAEAEDEELIGGIKNWLEEHAQLTEDHRLAIDEWKELDGLLDGGSLEELEDTESQKLRISEESIQGLDSEEVSRIALDNEAEAQLPKLRDNRSDRREALADKKARLDEFGRAMPNVAEAEEEFSLAEAEHERVKRLGWTLATTQDFLMQAQDKIHRTLAPILRDALKPWLSKVTDGRYVDVTVDVETLMVRVSGSKGNWRNAALLSHGTTEQIYLLLRVAMARLLTKPGEICPLLFDDVTVNCDTKRQVAILNILHSVSSEQQVILFSQESETLEWARENLLKDRDRLVELDPTGIPA